MMMCWLGCDNTKGFELGLRPVMVLFILLTTERLYRAMNDQGGITFCTEHKLHNWRKSVAYPP